MTIIEGVMWWYICTALGWMFVALMHGRRKLVDYLWCDGVTLELTRLTTEGDRNACSRLYSAACRAAFAMGYRRVITYTLASEPGTSLRASGFVEDARLDSHDGWSHTAGPRALDMPRLFDPPKMPTEAKVRWVRLAA